MDPCICECIFVFQCGLCFFLKNVYLISKFSVSLCGSLIAIESQNFIGSGTIRRYGFAGVDMTLLEVCHCEGGL